MPVPAAVRNALIVVLLLAVGVATWVLLPDTPSHTQSTPPTETSAHPQPQLRQQRWNLRQTITQQPENAQLRVQLGELNLQMGEGEAAVGAFEKAIELGINPSTLRLQQAEAQWLQLRPGKALQILQDLKYIQPQKQARLLLLRGSIELFQSTERHSRATFRQLYDLLAPYLDGGVLAEEFRPTLDKLAKLENDHTIVAEVAAHARCKPGAGLRDNTTNTIESGGQRLQVGPGQRYQSIAAAIRASANNDVIELAAGSYREPAIRWPNHNVHVIAPNGLATIEPATEPAKPKQPLWQLGDGRVLLDQLQFRNHPIAIGLGSGAVLIQRSTFIGNQTAIAGGTHGTLQVRYSEFTKSAWHLDIGPIQRLELEGSWLRAASQDQLRSIAQQSIVRYNRIGDGENGRSRYLLNFPAGGMAYVIGNVLQQGLNASHRVLINYAENQQHEDSELQVVNNTFYNRLINGAFVFNHSQQPARLINNIFAGAPAPMLQGAGTFEHNLSRAAHGLRAPLQGDYRLTLKSAALDAAQDPGLSGSFDLTPDRQYLHPANMSQREAIAKPDMGALEFCAQP